ILPHRVKLNAVTVSRDGASIITVTNDAVVRIWGVKQLQTKDHRLGHRGAVWSVAAAPQQPLVASGGTDGTVRIWQIDYGSNPLRPCQGDVRAVAHAPQKPRVAVASTQGITIWDSVRAVRVEHHERDYQVNDITFSPNGEQLIAACDHGVVEVFSRKDSSPSARDSQGWTTKTFHAHSRRVYSVDLDSAGRYLVTAGEDKMARIWDITHVPQERNVFRHTKRVLCARFSTDDRWLYTACEDHVVRSWDRVHGVVRWSYDGHDGPVNWLAISPDQSTLASASSDKTVRLWNTESEKSLRVLEGPSQQVWKVTFTADGRRVLAVVGDGSVHIWDTESGETLSVLRGHTAAAWGISMSPHGTSFVTGGDDQHIRLWGMRAESLWSP
ncbi:MAG: WD40 repeat domain-containing protein, partial [Pirellulales bacterium]